MLTASGCAAIRPWWSTTIFNVGQSRQERYMPLAPERMARSMA